MESLDKFIADIVSKSKSDREYITSLVLPDSPCEITAEKRGAVFCKGTKPSRIAQLIAITREILVADAVFNPENGATEYLPTADYTKDNADINFIEDIAQCLDDMPRTLDEKLTVIVSGYVFTRAMDAHKMSEKELRSALSDIGIENLLIGTRLKVDYSGVTTPIWSNDYIGVFKGELGVAKGWISAENVSDGIAVSFNFFPKIENPESLALIATNFK